MTRIHYTECNRQADDTIPRFSRRGLFAVAATATATAFVAGCGLAQSSPPGLPTATPYIPPHTLSIANASKITRLTALETGALMIRSVAWRPDGRILAAGVESNIHLWDVPTHRWISTLPAPSGLIYDMAWSRDGSQLVSTGEQGAIHLWDVQARQVLASWNGHSAIIFSAAWSPDQRSIVTGSSDGYVEIWDAKTGSNRARWSGPPAGATLRHSTYPLAVYGVSWSPDGSRLASTRYDGNLFLWDAATGTVQASLQPHFGPNRASWSPDGKLLATTSDDGSVQLWSATSLKNTSTLLAHTDSGWAYAIAWSPDSSMLAMSREDGLFQVWDIAGQQELFAGSCGGLPVWGAAWSPDNHHLATGGDDGKLFLWGVR